MEKVLSNEKNSDRTSEEPFPRISFFQQRQLRDLHLYRQKIQ